MENRDYTLSSVKNAMRILHLFSMDNPELGVTEIASKLRLSMGTTHRLISTLSRAAYLEKSEENCKYRLGLTILRHCGVITSSLEIHREALPFLEQLVGKLGEAVHIGVLEGNEVVYLHKIECKHPIRLLSHIGKRNPAFCTSAGKVILAYQSDEIIKHVLQSELYPYGPKTITNPEILLENLMNIRRNGYSIAIDELHEGVVSIAVPVRDYTEEVIAAISAVGPKERITDDKIPYYIETLTLSGQELSMQLGFIG